MDSRNPYLAQCREAVYDEADEMLVLLCFFQEFGESRIVCLARSDFHYKHPGNPVPHIEMHRTAEMWKGKPFHISIYNDPERNREADSNPEGLGQDFRDRISKHLEDVKEGLADPDRQVARRLGDVVERDQQKGRIADLLADELVIRSKLKDIKF